jgi:hypothetical protein
MSHSPEKIQSNEALEKSVSRPAHVDEDGRPVLTVAEVGNASRRALNFRSIYAMVVFGCSAFMFGVSSLNTSACQWTYS